MTENIKRVTNPLTIIAIFAALAEINSTVAIALVKAELQEIFLWFVILFPTLLVSLFFVTLNFNSKVMYAPSDFSNEDNYLRVHAFVTKDQKELAVRLDTPQEDEDKGESKPKQVVENDEAKSKLDLNKQAKLFLTNLLDLLSPQYSSKIIDKLRVVNKGSGTYILDIRFNPELYDSSSEKLDFSFIIFEKEPTHFANSPLKKLARPKILRYELVGHGVNFYASSVDELGKKIIDWIEKTRNYLTPAENEPA